MIVVVGVICFCFEFFDGMFVVGGEVVDVVFDLFGIVDDGFGGVGYCVVCVMCIL